MTNRQKDLFLFLYEHRDDLPLQVKEIEARYNDEKDLDLAKSQFSRDLGKLSSPPKEWLEKVGNGVYDLTDKGKARADRLINPEKYEGKVPEDYRDLVLELEEYLWEYKEEDVYDSLSQNEAYKLHLSNLERFEPSIVDKFEEKPDTFIDGLNEALVSGEFGDSAEIDIVIDLDRFTQSIPSANSSANISSPLKAEGTVEVSKGPFAEVVSAEFECTQCGERYEKEQDSTQLKSPYKCECGSKRFEPIDREFLDVIVFKLSPSSRENQTLLCRYEPENIEEAVKIFRPGSKIEVSGIMRDQPENNNSKRVDLYLEVMNFERKEKEFDVERVDSEEFDEVRDIVTEIDQGDRFDHPFDALSQSIAPHIAGLETAKDVVTASLVGASNHESMENHVKHDRIHSMIVGNPGIGKTEVMESALESMPKSVVVNGTQASGVGLTATVEKEESDNFALKAGRIVQADKGYMGLNELDKIGEGEEGKLNQALQKGYFTLDKASQNAELPARTTVIATANYKDEVEEGYNLKANMPDIDSSFRDRFGLEYYIHPDSQSDDAADLIFGLDEGDDPVYSSDEISLLVVLARDIDPALTDGAKRLGRDWVKGDLDIEEFKNFTTFASSSNRPMIHLMKLSCAFARSRLSSTAEERDMKRAIRLYSDVHRGYEG